MSEHTAGPWVWVGEDALFGNDGEVLNAADDGKPWGLHSSRIEHHYDPLVAAANRRLIAAAPEMYEALKEIASTDPIDAALDPQRAVRVARAVLAKIDKEPT